jgi:hypothetical protein
MKFYVLLESYSDLLDDFEGKSFDEIYEIIKKQALDDTATKLIGCYKEIPKVESEKVKPCQNKECTSFKENEKDGLNCWMMWNFAVPKCHQYKP